MNKNSKDRRVLNHNLITFLQFRCNKIDIKTMAMWLVLYCGVIEAEARNSHLKLRCFEGKNLKRAGCGSHPGKEQRETKGIHTMQKKIYISSYLEGRVCATYVMYNKDPKDSWLWQ